MVGKEKQTMIHLFRDRKTFSCGKRAKGFTLVELMVAAVISSLVMAGVIAIQYLTAKTINDLYGPTRSRSVRMIALNQIRFRLCDGKIGSVVVSDGNHRIQFEDPNLSAGGTPVLSEFYFDTANRILYYDADIAHPNPTKVAKGPINVMFIKGSLALDAPNFKVYKGTDAVVTVFVQTSYELAYSKVDLRDGETLVYLRNK